MDLQLKLKDAEDELKGIKKELKYEQELFRTATNWRTLSIPPFILSLEKKESDLTNQITTLISKIPQQGNILIKFNVNLILVIKNNE